MRVCQYISNSHPHYMRMAANSMFMLRKHNPIIKVRLFLIMDEGKITSTTNHAASDLPKYKSVDYLRIYNDLGVEVIQRNPLEIDGEEDFFHIHRSLYKETEADSLLFIDADTFIFNDVDLLFDKYNHYDYVGLPINYLDGWDKSWLPFKPFNSAVNLWNNGWARKFGEELPHWCRKLRERDHIVSDWCYQKCARCTNREEISTSLFVAEHGLSNAVWDRNDVRNSGSLNDYDDADKTTIFHTFTHNWMRAWNLYCRSGKKKLGCRLIKAGVAQR